MFSRKVSADSHTQYSLTPRWPLLAFSGSLLAWAWVYHLICHLLTGSLHTNFIEGNINEQTLNMINFRREWIFKDIADKEIALKHERDCKTHFYQIT